jgi:hypothetical protein
MAISRPFLLALLGVALLGATVFAVQNARNTSDEPASVAQQPADQATPAPEPAAPAGPDQIIESAFTTDFDSASFKAAISFTSLGEKNVFRASGSAEDHGDKAMPEVDVRLSANVPSLDFNESGGFVSTGDRAWFTRGSKAYAVPQGIWSRLVKAQESGKPALDEGPDIYFNATSWVRNAKEEGKEQVGGVQTTHVSAQFDSAKAFTAIFKAASQGGQIPTPLPDAEQRLRKSGLTTGKLDVWVGEDKVLRRMTLSLSGRGDNNRPVRANLSLLLSGVNEPQKIVKPSNVVTGTPGGTYGRLTNSVLEEIAQGVGVDDKKLHLGTPRTNSHLKAERAVADNKKVVVFFQNPRALDDKAVADSVRSLDRRTKNVVVLTDDVGNVDRYGKLLENLGVTQAPAIVVIGRSGKASLVEGYVDGPSLAQVVADAR